jgi:hypothetical protein
MDLTTVQYWTVSASGTASQAAGKIGFAREMSKAFDELF